VRETVRRWRGTLRRCGSRRAPEMVPSSGTRSILGSDGTGGAEKNVGTRWPKTVAVEGCRRPVPSEEVSRERKEEHEYAPNAESGT